jgi:hypothetical protein
MTSKGPNVLLKAFGLVDKGDLRTRTKQNIVDSDATVVLSGDMQSSGTVLTLRLCKELKKPVLALDISEACAQYGDTGSTPVASIGPLCKNILDFVLKHEVRVLNVAGNRERFSDSRTTYVVRDVISAALSQLALEHKLIPKC